MIYVLGRVVERFVLAARKWGEVARGHMVNTAPVLHPSVQLLVKRRRRRLRALFGKIAKDAAHRRGTLTLDGYSTLCMIVISATLKQVEVVGVSALSTAENKLLVYGNPLLLVISIPPPESLNVTL